MPAPSEADVAEARDQAEAARLYGDAQKSIQRDQLQDARNRLELLLSNYPMSHLADIARRDLRRVYEKLASDLETRPMVAIKPQVLPPGVQATAPGVDGGYRPARQPLIDQTAPPPFGTGQSAISPRPPAADPPAAAKAIDFLKDEFRNTAGDRIFFNDGSADFGTRARTGLEAQASWLRRNPGVSVIVEGHADDAGSREFNRDLSRRRAESVKAKLVELGVDPQRIEILAFGRDRPLTDCNGPACANQNRLVLTTISRVTVATAP